MTSKLISQARALIKKLKPGSEKDSKDLRKDRKKLLTELKFIGKKYKNKMNTFQKIKCDLIYLSKGLEKALVGKYTGKLPSNKKIDKTGAVAYILLNLVNDAIECDKIGDGNIELKIKNIIKSIDSVTKNNSLDESDLFNNTDVINNLKSVKATFSSNLRELLNDKNNDRILKDIEDIEREIDNFRDADKYEEERSIIIKILNLLGRLTVINENNGDEAKLFIKNFSVPFSRAMQFGAINTIGVWELYKEAFENAYIKGSYYKELEFKEKKSFNIAIGNLLNYLDIKIMKNSSLEG